MIVVQDVTRTFRAEGRQVAALEGVSLRVNVGETFGLVGPSGSGKTCLVDIIAGLVTPDSGRVTVDGLDPTRHPGKVLRRLGVMLEGGQGLSGRLTVQENLMYSGYLRGLRGSLLAARMSSLLDFFALASSRYQPTASLGRAAHRRLALAAALVGDPPVLVLDDPTRGLDLQEALEIRHLIAELSRDGGRTILIATRQTATAAELCSGVAVINRGRILRSGQAVELFQGFSRPPYRLVIRTPSPRVMSRLAGGLEMFYPGARLCPDGRCTTVSVEATPPRLVYSVLSFLGENECQLLEVAAGGEEPEERYLELAGGEESLGNTDRLVG